ncbi:hypothetical protein E4U43_002016 [Claviceps pusilla]|uniref:Multicopper oxidase n=1 Tax=Claviceps pusilla TaxID=123648 RepID=A0A9P7N9C0_9HYPO|nr:hypothetical protein E4U43_002016 [Claviceps pusilla]
MWTSICVMSMLFLALYVTIVADLGFVPRKSWAWQNSVNSLNIDIDPFALHPEQHIFRRPRTIALHWNITRGPRRPDGVLKQVYLINGQFPGPTVEARSGDELHISVFNGIADADEGIAIHWHGMTLKGSNEMDGVVGITQCAVGPGSTFAYKFNVDQEQHGTFWYHAHSAVQRADGMYGGLVVHKPVGKGRNQQSDLSVHEYDSEKLLLVGDWYHMSADKVLAEYRDFRSFSNEPVPDSLLINGAGSYNCSNARPGKPVDCVETDVPMVRMTGKRVRLRIVNTGASAGYSLQLDNAAMQLVTVDGGGPVLKPAPWTSTLGVLYPGERMDVVIFPTDEQQQQSPVLKMALDPELMQLMNPALTRMQEFPLNWTRSHISSGSAEVGDGWELVNVFNLENAQGHPVALDEAPADTTVLYTSLGINAFKKNEPWGELNHTSWVWRDPYAKPLLAMDKNAWHSGTEQANPLRTFKVPRFEAGEQRWMDLVVNNVDDRGHPFHFHGHEFYVLASRQDDLDRAYNPYEYHDAEIPVNTNNPLRKDTVYIKPRGYVILRFQLNNHGLWLIHCHVVWHQAVGMGAVLQVGNIEEATARNTAYSCRGLRDMVDGEVGQKTKTS